MRQRELWAALLVFAMFGALTVPSAQARARHSDAWAREHFATAERLREALNGRPAADRTRRDYQRVLNAYRNIYMGAPNSPKADPSVVAVAETLVEMGRRFDDDKILLSAISQYRYLRREYPGSKYRFGALFTIGEIYKDDLNDSFSARAIFEEFLGHYPNNRLADDARQAIAEINREAKAGKDTGTTRAADKKEQKNEKNNVSGKGKEDEDRGTSEVAGDESGSHKNIGKEESTGARSRHLARVTAVRHWSTPDYTRIAIDLEGDVKFSAQRIAKPARIFFDLHDTKLASTLVGKSLDVDDGFLKKIRVAQFAPGRTRVVLDVANLSEYDAFLLPNPYRLIIDIHGKDSWVKQPNDAGESMAGVSSPPIPDADHDASSEPQSPTGQPEAPTGSPSDTLAVNKKPQSAVVKRVVEADDDDDVSPETSKGNSRKVKTVAAKKDLSGDPDGELDASDSKVLTSKRNHIVDSRHRSSRADEKLSKGSDFNIREATPTASGDRSLIRALGLKIGRIVIDPGHGGHDTGTIGPNGLEEKDLVLEVGRRLGKLLETRLGAEVVYTRKNDTFIPLETRTAVANQARADLFVSIHANASRDSDARGVETYYLNFTSSPEALEVAARENAVSEKSIYELQDLVKKIALKEKIEESREFASDVQQSLHSGLATKSSAIRDRGVKKAPFIVLIGANMPSILAEISFVSNPTDERRLATSEYRQRIAESLYRGIAKYVNGLSGVKMASKMAAGQ
ncbi:MAG: N-acetylmuramoyl-L-alanine amidase [Candidatus Sulfotelmatobacter sp.]|nr:N-acetylmuramoyl-L-alanine amidase [Candidatus Sulfotelmatobacter sp.]